MCIRDSARAEIAHVGPAQRPGAAEGGRPERLGRRHPQGLHRECDHEGHRRRVAGARVAVGAQRYGDAGVQEAVSYTHLDVYKRQVLVSSHVLSELEEVYDHAVFLSKGRTVEATAVDARTAERGWRLDALDPVALRTFLTNAGIPWARSSGGEVIVQLAGTDSAMQLVRAAVAAGVALHTIAPVAGRLEEAYLALDEAVSYTHLDVYKRQTSR